MNPLDWTAQPFLTLYLCLVVFAVTANLLVREWVCRANAPPGISPLERDMPEQGMPALDVVEWAYLAGGRKRAAQTVMLGLLAAGAATLDAKSSTFAIDATCCRLPPELEPFRPNVADKLSLWNFYLAMSSKMDWLEAKLRERGLSPKVADIDLIRKITLAFTVVLVVFGILKIVVGASRGHQIGYLFCLVLLTALLGAFGLLRMPFCTKAGADAIAAARARHARAARAPLESELTLAFALTGAAVLGGTPYAAFAEEISPSGGGDSGSGGGGDGGGGCGGCS
jgi:uncharacterized protein (TIGR04222 family)